MNYAGQSLIPSLSQFFLEITKDFNKYAKENNMDIQLEFTLFSRQNTTNEWDSFDSSVHLLLERRSTKYDFLIYDPLFTRRLSRHFVDLNEYLPQQHLNEYKGNSEKVGKYKGQWVGVVST